MRLSEHELRDRVYGCWLGKSLGGVIGGPHEGNLDYLDLPRIYPTTTMANDDLDLQLVWLHMLEQKGLNVGPAEFAEAWDKHLVYPFDEYGVAVANVRRSVMPPHSGVRDNWFTEGMGAAIRSEIWACLFPNRPELAARYAWLDAQVDHADEGIYSEVVLAVFESLCFGKTPDDIPALLSESLTYLPEHSETRKAMQFVLDRHKAGDTPRAVRDAVLECWEDENFTHCVQNLAFTALGLLWSKGDPLEAIIVASNCGYDVDCTAATAGAAMGILIGGKRLQELANHAINEEVVVGYGVVGCKFPKSVGELCDRTMALAARATTDLPKLPAGWDKKLPVPATPEMTIPFRIAAVSATLSAREPLLNEAKPVAIHTLYPTWGELAPAKDAAALAISTDFDIKAARQLRFMPVWMGAMRVWVDGKEVYSQDGIDRFIPAPHRCEVKTPALDFAPGKHRVTVQIVRTDKRDVLGWIVAGEGHHLVFDLPYLTPCEARA